MAEPDHLHVCIMGHSGVGKSPLSKLFRVPGWDPFRVRKPRDKNDKAMTREDFTTLLVDGVLDAGGKRYERGPLVYPPPRTTKESIDGHFIRRRYEEHGLCVCTGWSFLRVRDADQCLCHDDFTAKASMRVEVFAPRLLEMIRERDRLEPAFHLNTDNLLVVLLNPTARSFAEKRRGPSDELRLSTALAVMERARADGTVPDLADALRRVGHLKEELQAWRSLITDGGVHCLECREWAHFEYRYRADEAAELDRARASLFRAIRAHPRWTEQEKSTWAGRLQLCCMA